MGSSARRVHGHYQALLTLLADGGGDSNGSGGLCNKTSSDFKVSDTGIIEKWTNQIEKVSKYFFFLSTLLESYGFG